MPELPEVQTVIDHLAAAGVPGRRIESLRLYWPRAVDRPSASRFSRGLRGRTIRRLSRRGKFLVFELDRGWLLIHLRMSGRLTLEPAGTARDPHDRALFVLDDGRELRFHDPRKFGRLFLVQDPGEVLAPLGPEPLEPAWSSAELFQRLRAHRRMLKPLLLDQRFLAGLGNIYADEALWAARLHPLRRSDTLDENEARRLHRALRRVLRQAVANLGTSLGAGEGNFRSLNGESGRHAEQLRVYRRTGLPCPRCGHPIVRAIVAQRGTHFCPACQPRRG